MRVAAPKPRVAGRRRLVDHEDGLAGPIVARLRHPRLQVIPQLADCALVTDDHARPSP
jgi:hypothetical protein